MIVINAEDKVLGRIATVAAKQALLGENVAIVNCGKAVMSGNRKDILKKYSARLQRGRPQQGPFTQRRPDQFVRKSVAGMLPRKQEKGKNALGRVKCYLGFPENLKKETVHDDSKTAKKSSVLMHYVRVRDICREMGSKA